MDLQLLQTNYENKLSARALLTTLSATKETSTETSKNILASTQDKIDNHEVDKLNQIKIQHPH